MSRFSWFTSWRRQVPDLYAFEQGLGPILDSLAPDVVHAHDLPALGVAVRHRRRAALIGKAPKVIFDAIEDWDGLPYYSHINPRYLAAMQKYEAEYVGEVDAVITVSRTVADAMRHRRRKLPIPVEVMSCPRLAGQMPSELNLRSELGVAADTKLMIYSGGLNAARGLDVAVAALPELPDWHLGVVSLPFPHPMEAGFREQAERLGVAHRLSFAQPVPGTQILDYLSTADVGLIPLSTRFANLRAAMPNKLFEYINAGLPVVSSDCSEMERFLTDHELGATFVYPNPTGLALAVEAVHQKYPEGIGLDVREALREFITWEAQEAILESCYLRLLGRAH